VFNWVKKVQRWQENNTSGRPQVVSRYANRMVLRSHTEAPKEMAVMYYLRGEHVELAVV
jgi:hypothetical protein